MKKIIVSAIVAVVLLSSCKKEKNIHWEARYGTVDRIQLNGVTQSIQPSYKMEKNDVLAVRVKADSTRNYIEVLFDNDGDFSDVIPVVANTSPYTGTGYGEVTYTNK